MLRTHSEGQIAHPLAMGGGPQWAAEWGEDRDFGPFAVLEVPGNRVPGTNSQPPVRQTFRWAPPGSFRMGAPDDEAGRFDDEGPVHWVTLSHGFWIADTPCTQELWQAVMGDNPSHFQECDGPVESVSWDGIGSFLNRLNRQISGLNVTLPTEAQWEYACRAGSQSAIYPVAHMHQHPANQTKGPFMDPLHAIAWYSVNSGGKTRPVKQKLPNAWGLYDMLGNVWEWCLDGNRRYDSMPCRDPVGPDVGSRCVRGGSWSHRARYVRCACRHQSKSGDRDEGLGFRLVRVQDGS